MYLFEHDAKELLRQYGVALPPGCLVEALESFTPPPLPPGPWVVKGQIAAGGRGKAGIIRKAATVSDVRTHITGILGAGVNGHTVKAVRVEQDVGAAEEAYIALLLTAQGQVQVLVSSEGGIHVERAAGAAAGLKSDVAALSCPAIRQCIDKLSRQLPPRIAPAIIEVGESLARAFVECEALLVEINPLFVRPDGSWIVGDAKIVTDDNALERQTALQTLVQSRPHAYAEVALKLEHGFDYVVVDDAGEIGLITSGAGLCMMLIDELRAAGLKPYNFLDVRASAFHGSTARLVNVLTWILQGKDVKMIMVNMIAGGGDVGEHAELLVKALDEVGFRLPVVIRFAGRNLEHGKRVLAERGMPLITDLDEAIAEVGRVLSGPRVQS